MKGFVDSTKTRYISGKSCGSGLRGAAQVATTMRHYRTGGRVEPVKPCGCKK